MRLLGGWIDSFPALFESFNKREILARSVDFRVVKIYAETRFLKLDNLYKKTVNVQVASDIRFFHRLLAIPDISETSGVNCMN
jgi:hypothetical protein